MASGSTRSLEVWSLLIGGEPESSLSGRLLGIVVSSGSASGFCGARALQGSPPYGKGEDVGAGEAFGRLLNRRHLRLVRRGRFFRDFWSSLGLGMVSLVRGSRSLVPDFPSVEQGPERGCGLGRRRESCCCVSLVVGGLVVCCPGHRHFMSNIWVYVQSLVSKGTM